ncbi:MAG: hypothetical protein AAF562_12145 [Pseudomonadota bacterium]
MRLALIILVAASSLAACMEEVQPDGHGVVYVDRPAIEAGAY